MWHGLGVVLPDYLDRDEAYGLSGQDWFVGQHELFLAGGRKVDGHFAAVREDTGAILAVHQDSYEVLQNTEGWDLADAIVNQDEAIRYETGITLKGGAVCCVLLRDEGYTIPGDDSATVPFLLVSWAHDGSAAMVATATDVRVVCKNTLNLALGKGTRRFAFRHTKNVRDRIEFAKASVTGMRENTARYRKLATYLASKPVSPTGLYNFLQAVIPTPEGENVTEKAKDKAREGRRDLNHLILTGNTVPDGLRQTGYGLLQGGIEYLDWFGSKSRSDETRFSRVMLTGDAPKQKLLAAVRVAVGA
jgi:phage/plasmid-like protein (TIGR03299 family)